MPAKKESEPIHLQQPGIVGLGVVDQERLRFAHGGKRPWIGEEHIVSTHLQPLFVLLVVVAVKDSIVGTRSGQPTGQAGVVLNRQTAPRKRELGALSSVMMEIFPICEPRRHQKGIPVYVAKDEVDLTTVLIEEMPQRKRSADVTAVDKGLNTLVHHVGADTVQGGPVIVCV